MCGTDFSECTILNNHVSFRKTVWPIPYLVAILNNQIHPVWKLALPAYLCLIIDSQKSFFFPYVTALPPALLGGTWVPHSTPSSSLQKIHVTFNNKILKHYHTYLWAHSLIFAVYAYSRRICPLEYFLFFVFLAQKKKKCPTGKCDGYMRMLQMNAPFIYWTITLKNNNNKKKLQTIASH